ncbi:MAG TPA: dTDP-glucose 4,6-dehydratase [Anaerolineales bacterium]|nr:dTDP-glucose 4,6-dehydratase [Anaerolineales bacterium]
MKRLLVTGGAGFIGSNFVRHLLASDPDILVVNLDALTYAGSPANLEDLPDPSRHVFVHGDITDRPLVDGLLRRHTIDTIVHLAAETHVDRSIVGPAEFVRTNIEGTFILLEVARKAWLEDKLLPVGEVRFHHVSTDEVYGALDPAEPAADEEHAYRPTSPYAASKAASDHLVRAYARTYGLPVTLSNCSNNYGPRQFPEKLIPLMILNALEGKPLPVYGDGRQIRDWVHVDDHCEGLRTILRRGRPGETYHVGGGVQVANLDLLHSLCGLLDLRRPSTRPYAELIAFVADRPGHDRRYALDIGKIERELDWQPRETLDTGLAKTVDWYFDHPAWIEAIRAQPGYRAWLERNYAARGSNG